MDREAAEALANSALGDAIRDRCNAMLADGHALEAVVAWAREHGSDFYRIREDAIAVAMGDQATATCSCQAHR
jgi:hypothetical protein